MCVQPASSLLPVCLQLASSLPPACLQAASSLRPACLAGGRLSGGAVGGGAGLGTFCPKIVLASPPTRKPVGFEAAQVVEFGEFRIGARRNSGGKFARLGKVRVLNKGKCARLEHSPSVGFVK